MKSLSLVALATIALAGPLAAQDVATDAPIAVSFAEDTGDIQRIGAAKILRTYSQKIPAVACYMYNGVDLEGNRKLLKDARAKFDLKLKALRYGDEDLGIIGDEKRKKTIARLDEVQAVWSKINGAVDTLIEKPDDKAAVAIVKGTNIEFFEVTDVLVTEVSGQYSNPSVIDKSQALRLNIVGRTATMTQKIAKNTCMSVTYPEDETYKERLTEAAGIYEASLNALRSGMPEIGLQAAPTEEIEAALAEIQANWTVTKADVDTVLAGKSFDAAAIGPFYIRMLADMRSMKEVMRAYEEYADYDY